MNGRYILLLAGFLGITFLNGQSIELLNPPQGLLDVSKDSAEEKIAFQIKNNTTDTLKFALLRLENQMHAASDTAHSTYFCWDFCYGTSVNQSADGIFINPGDTLNTASYQQYISFQPGGIDGYSFTTLRFINMNDLDDYLDVKYEFSVGGANPIEGELNPTKILSSPFPNPANQIAYINYDLPLSIKMAELRILNIIGKEVIRIKLENHVGVAEIPLETLKSGIYIVSLRVEGKNITSRKLIISK